MLKAIMLRKKLSEVTKKLTEAREKAKELATREKELEAAIDEAQTEEEKEAVNQEVEQYEKDKAEMRNPSGIWNRKYLIQRKSLLIWRRNRDRLHRQQIQQREEKIQ